MNTLLQTTLKDAATYSHPFDESKKRWEGKCKLPHYIIVNPILCFLGARVDEVFGPDAHFFESFNAEKEQAALARIAEYALHQNPQAQIDDLHSFILPQVKTLHSLSSSSSSPYAFALGSGRISRVFVSLRPCA